MSDTQHVLERREKLLASRLKSRVELLRDALAPPGHRPPFHDQLSKPDALVWWKQHRYDDMGKRVLSNMQPESILELDVALSKQAEREQFGGSWPAEEGADSI